MDCEIVRRLDRGTKHSLEGRGNLSLSTCLTGSPKEKTSFDMMIWDGVYVFAGVISGALLYIRDDFKSVDRNTVLQVLN